MTKQTLSSRCFESLKSSILKGELLPGDKLLCEELKEQLHVGMSPIREALAKLIATNLVTFEERRGYAVRKMDAGELRDNILSYAEIECLCLRLAIAHGRDEWESGIVAALHCLKKAETPPLYRERWQQLNANFHQALIAACPRRALLEIRHEFHRRHQWITSFAFRFADIAANHLEHQTLAELAIARDTEGASQQLFDHITSTREELIAELMKGGLIHGTS